MKAKCKKDLFEETYHELEKENKLCSKGKIYGVIGISKNQYEIFEKGKSLGVIPLQKFHNHFKFTNLK